MKMPPYRSLTPPPLTHEQRLMIAAHNVGFAQRMLEIATEKFREVLHEAEAGCSVPATERAEG